MFNFFNKTPKLQGGISSNNFLQGAGNSPLSSSGSGSGSSSLFSLGASKSGGSNSGSSMGSGGMVQGGEAPGIWGEIKKEVDARKAGISNALENYADNMGNIALAANSFSPNFNPTASYVQPLQPVQSNLYNYLIR